MTDDERDSVQCTRCQSGSCCSGCRRVASWVLLLPVLALLLAVAAAIGCSPGLSHQLASAWWHRGVPVPQLEASSANGPVLVHSGSSSPHPHVAASVTNPAAADGVITPGGGIRRIHGLDLQQVEAAAAPASQPHDVGNSSSRPPLGWDVPVVDIEGIISQRMRLNISGEDAGEHLREIWSTVDFIFKAPSLLDHDASRVTELRWDRPRELIALASRMGEPMSPNAFLQQLEQASAILDELSGKLCWPIVRRSILAGIIKRRLQAGPFSAAVSRAVTALSLKLVLKHKDAAAYKGAVEFFHVSKAGGTSFCQLAQANGCATQDFKEYRNCLIREFNDLPRWINESLHHQLSGRTNTTPSHFMRVPWFVNYSQKRNHISCFIRRKFLASKRWTIYANEYTLHGGRTATTTAHVCANILTVLLFRHPVPRLKSHVRWIRGLYQAVYGPVNASLFFPPGRVNAQHWQRLAPAVVTNYYTRSLLGEGTYQLPADQLTSAHATRARLAVMQFDVLLTLEQTSLNRVLFRHALGWRHSLSDANRTRTSHGMTEEAEALPQDLLEKLEALNSLDMELYKFSLLLSMLDAIVFDVAAAVGIDPESEIGAKYKADMPARKAGLKCGYVSLNSTSGSEFPFTRRPVALPGHKPRRRRRAARPTNTTRVT